jgi:hypothetical protein
MRTSRRFQPSFESMSARIAPSTIGLIGHGVDGPRPVTPTLDTSDDPTDPPSGAGTGPIILDPPGGSTTGSVC